MQVNQRKKEIKARPDALENTHTMCWGGQTFWSKRSEKVFSILYYDHD